MSETSPSVKLNKSKATPKVTKNAASADSTDEVVVVETVTVTQTIEPAPVQAQAVKKTKAESVEKVETPEADQDLIIKVAHEVENLSEKKAFELVPRLLNGIEQDYFKLGGVISVIQSNGWFMEKGYENFKAYVVAEVGIEYRRAMYFIGIYNSLVSSGVKWSDVKNLGWTKLKEISGILTPENVGEWVSLAEQMTVLQLQEYIKQQKAAITNDASGPISDDQAKKTTTITFKVHEDQKATIREALEKCKAEMNTEYDAVALEHIALDFLSGDKKLKKVPTLQEQMAGKSAEEVLEIFSKVFPEVELSAEV